jgi:hypothetical protein
VEEVMTYPEARSGSESGDKETVPTKDAEKPMFSASQLSETPPRTPEDVRRDVRNGRFAEMTLDQAGAARPVIFLDMDDVLCLDSEFHSGEMLLVIQQKRPDWPELWERLVDVDAAANLLRLHEEFNPEYVISSSWALHLDREQMCEVLERTQLQFVVYNLHENWQTQRARSSIRRPAPPICPCCGNPIVPKAVPLPLPSKAELQEITRAAREAERLAKAESRAASKLAREIEEARQKEEKAAAKLAKAEAKAIKDAEEKAAREAAAVIRKAEEYACKDIDELTALGRARGYPAPRHWAEVWFATRKTYKPSRRGL